MIKNIFITLLIISCLLLVYVSFRENTLLDIGGNAKENYYPYLRLYFSIYFSVLILFSFKKNIKLQSMFSLIWLIPITYIFFNYFFGITNLKKIDFFIGKKITNIKVREYKVRDWPVKEIVIKTNKNENDTIYYSGNPCCDKKIFTLNEIKNAKISRSLLTGYYYISTPKTFPNNSKLDKSLQ